MRAQVPYQLTTTSFIPKGKTMMGIGVIRIGGRLMMNRVKLTSILNIKSVILASQVVVQLLLIITTQVQIQGH